MTAVNMDRFMKQETSYVHITTSELTYEYLAIEVNIVEMGE
jgi:hypothetical protein